MSYILTKAERETIINYDEELHTASIYTHDQRMIKKLRELSKKFPEQFVLERKGPCQAVTYTIPKKCVNIRPPYSESRKAAQRKKAVDDGMPFVTGNQSVMMARQAKIRKETEGYDDGEN